MKFFNKDVLLEPWQVQNLLDKIGCVQCGSPSTHVTDGGHECCDTASCKFELERIENDRGLWSILTYELDGVDWTELR